jgi:hypothetical protein
LQHKYFIECVWPVRNKFSGCRLFICSSLRGPAAVMI